MNGGNIMKTHQWCISDNRRRSWDIGHLLLKNPEGGCDAAAGGTGVRESQRLRAAGAGGFGFRKKEANKIVRK